MWQAVLDALQAAWDWIVGLLIGLGQSVIGMVMGLMPQSVQDGLASQTSVVGFALSATNAWVPLDYAVTLASMYIVFVVSFLAVKILIKLIP